MWVQIPLKWVHMPYSNISKGGSMICLKYGSKDGFIGLNTTKYRCVHRHLIQVKMGPYRPLINIEKISFQCLLNGYMDAIR